MHLFPWQNWVYLTGSHMHTMHVMVYITVKLWIPPLCIIFLLEFKLPFKSSGLLNWLNLWLSWRYRTQIKTSSATVIISNSPNSTHNTERVPPTTATLLAPSALLASSVESSEIVTVTVGVAVDLTWFRSVIIKIILNSELRNKDTLRTLYAERYAVLFYKRFTPPRHACIYREETLFHWHAQI